MENGEDKIGSNSNSKVFGWDLGGGAGWFLGCFLVSLTCRENGGGRGA